MVTYGLTLQLRLLAVEGPNDEIRRLAGEELLRLGTLPDEDEWARGLDVFELLLEALQEVYRNRNLAQQTVAVLCKLEHHFENRPTLKDLQRKFETWRGRQSVEGKLRSGNKFVPVTSDQLFLKTRQLMRIKMTHEEVIANVEALKKNYRSLQFSEMTMLLENDEKRNVKEYEFEIECLEVVEEEAFPDKRSFSEDEDEDKAEGNHLQQDRRRISRVRKSVKLDELFNPRQIRPEKPAEPVSRVLLVGNPGVGKTSLSKKYALSWAEGQLGREFPAVYVLPFRNLTKKGFEEIENVSRKRTLATAIANFCFPKETNEDRYENRRTLIADELTKPTTLLILDGFDETDGIGKELLHQAFELDCRLLLTSRPYNLRDVRRNVDVEMECVGLNDSQLKRFFSREMTQSESSALIEYLQSKPNMWKMAHVSLIANILCLLWKKRGAATSPEDALGSNEHSLYTKMTNYIWERYSEQPTFPQGADRKETFHVLGQIAFECRKTGDVLIDREVVFKYATKEPLKKTLKDSGFLLLKEEGTKYQFPHLTFLEYFAGLYLSHSLFEKTAANKDKKDAIAFISNRKYEDVQQVTLAFMMQESATEGLSALDEIFSIVDQEPRDILGIKHLGLKASLLEHFLSGLENTNVARSHRNCVQLVEKLALLPLVMDRGIDFTLSILRLLIKLPNTIKTFPRITAIVLLTLEFHEKRKNFQKKTPQISSHETKEVLSKFIKDYENRITKERQLGEPLMSDSSVDDFLTLVDNESESALRGTEMNNLYKHRIQIACAVAKHVPKACEYVWSLLLTLSQTDSWRVRRSAASGTLKIVETFPEKAKDAIALLSKMRQDGDWNVRESAASGISKIIETSPEKVADAFAVLSTMCRDDDPNARYTAASGISKIVKTSPEKVADAFAVLSTMCRDGDPNVRESAASGISKIVETSPEKVADAFALLSTMCRHNIWNVRKSAASGISKIVQTFPEKTADVFSVLSTMCRDDNLNIFDAIIFICKNISNISDELLRSVVEFAGSLFAEKVFQRCIALLVIENVSPIRVIDLFLQRHLKSETHFILLSNILMENVLAFSKTYENAPRLILFDLENAKKWDVSFQQLDDLKSDLLSAVRKSSFALSLILFDSD